jgi:hypothetical protein
MDPQCVRIKRVHEEMKGLGLREIFQRKLLLQYHGWRLEVEIITNYVVRHNRK